jgi:hypothetical protein
MCDFGDSGADGDIISSGDGFDIFEIFGPRRDNFLLRICLAVGMALLFICLTPFGYIIFPEWIKNIFESAFDCGIWIYESSIKAPNSTHPHPTHDLQNFQTRTDF